MDLQRIKSITNEVWYRNWKFEVFERAGEVFIRANFYARNADGKFTARGLVKSRPFNISDHATESEIVQTCLMCVQCAEEHERREFFRYKGQQIFNPHYDINEFVKLCKNGKGTGGARK